MPPPRAGRWICPESRCSFLWVQGSTGSMVCAHPVAVIRWFVGSKDAMSRCSPHRCSSRLMIFTDARIAATAVFRRLISITRHAISKILQSLDKMVSLMTPSTQKVHRLLDKMRAHPKSVTYSELVQVCGHYFGKSRQSGTSHAVFATPWPGDPRVNIQNMARRRHTR